MTNKKLTKEQAHAMYDDLHKAMEGMLQQRAAVARSKDGSTTKSASGAAAGRTPASPPPASEPQQKKERSSTVKAPVGRPMMRSRRGDGQALALMVFACLGCAKIALSAVEASGIVKVEEARAVVVQAPAGPRWTKEEAKVLTSLDARRVDLEERSARIEKREEEFSVRERELAVRLTELKDLTERLKLEREKGDKQRNTQLDQLANVYGSMNPPEAAQLLQQLDIQVCLSLIERMPEKRMGQILSLMNPQRALELTNLLSKRKA
jgi:flagellar motility protein MotE (MotC chaperone)